MSGWIIGVVLASAALAARADVVVSSLGSTQDVNFGDRIDGSIFHASEFMTDGTSYLLTSVEAVVDSDSLVRAWICADDGGLPGTQLFELDSVGATSGWETVTFTAGSAFELAANTPYHIVLNAPGGRAGHADWGVSISGSESFDGPGIMEFARETSLNGGTSWINIPQILQLYRVNGTPVPTPGGAVLLGLGGIAAARRRRGR